MAFKMKYGKGAAFNYGNKSKPLEFNSGLRQASKDGKLDNNPEFKNKVDNSLFTFTPPSKEMKDSMSDGSNMKENRKAQFNKIKEKVGVIGKKIFGKKKNRTIVKDKINKEKINAKRVSVAENMPEYKNTVKTSGGKKSLRSYTEAYKAKENDAEFMKKYPTQKSFEDAAEAWWKTQGAGSPKKYKKKKK